MGSEQNLQAGRYKPANFISKTIEDFEDEEQAKEKKKRSICYVVVTLMALGGITSISVLGALHRVDYLNINQTMTEPLEENDIITNVCNPSNITNGTIKCGFPCFDKDFEIR